MAIEIIKRGTPLEEQVYNATCNGCKSELRWLQKDAMRVEYSKTLGEAGFTQIACPVCTRTVTGYDKK